MKRYFIGALVGAILLFGWQSIAHTVMHHHDPAYRTVPNQEQVLSTLSGIFKEEGQYFLPMHDVNASTEEQERFMENMKGKPWAQVVFHPRWEYNMGSAMLRSFTTAFLCVLIFIWILGRNPGTYGNIVLKSVGLGSAMFMFVWYNQNIWMQTPWEVLQGELIDLLVGWGLCGLWLGWWLNRKTGRRV